MTLSAGTRVGSYEITAKIGEGGMGEVYRATDTNLNRPVAIKVLPEAVAADPDRLARFDREAKTLATLNHPNIAQIYGLERIEGTIALVMELVPGPTLADRIKAGPIPVEEALPIAKQIAEALELAHDQGIVHRDLKPANVKVRDDGMVKVLDFGLAKAVEPVGPPSSMSLSPTITTPPMTYAGVILGTPAYMSPEQARGRTVDKRTDIWAFGCVLYEMLTGRRTFADEESVSDTLAAILKGEPDWSAVPADTPSSVRRLLERCLRKDVRRRLQNIADARIEIEDACTEPAPSTPSRAVVVSRRGAYLWPLIAVVAIVVAVTMTLWQFATPVPEVPVVRFDVVSPEGVTLDVGQAISPDGRKLAFVSSFEGKSVIWIRSLDSETAQPLPGTEDAFRPVWSPNSQYVAFFAQGKLKKVAAAGGPATAISTVTGRDLTWGTENVILIGGSRGGSGIALLRVPSTGGEPTPATELGANETTHDYPDFLPDGRHFLYMARHGADVEDWDLFVGSLDSKERRLLPGIHSGARYSPSGHLLFIVDRTLMAQAFDLNRLTLNGEPFPVADEANLGPRASFGTSRTGTLSYVRAAPRLESELAWFDRAGKQESVVGAKGEYGAAAVSPDARYIAFHRLVGQGSDIFLLDVEKASTSRFVSVPGADFSPIWSPDGKTIAFGSSREPAGNSGPNNANGGQLYQRPVGAVSGDTVLLKTDAGKTPTDWSRDGRYIAYVSRDDVWALPMPPGDGVKPLRVTDTPFLESHAVFSPDGHWIAFQSNESGTQPEVFVQSFPEPGQKQQVSINGGVMPRWGSEGKELFYIADSTLMSVPVASTPAGTKFGVPAPVFSSRALANGLGYAVSRDGRFLLNVSNADPAPSPLAVVVNWAATLKK